MDPKIDSGFWMDPEIQELSPEEKLALLWMITNPDTNTLGVFRFAPNTFAFQTGLEAAWLSRAMKALPKMVVQAGNKVWLRKYIAYQLGRGPKLERNSMVGALVKPFWDAPPEIQNAVLHEYPELEKICETEGGQTPKRREREGLEESSSVHPTLAEVIKRAELLNITAEDATAFFQHYDGLGWVVRGQALVKWWQWLPKWKTRSEEISAQKKAAGRGRGESERGDAAQLEADLAHETDPAKREAIRKRLKELES